MGLQLSERILDGYAVVELRGELDLSSASELRERLLGIVSQQTSSLILDLSGLAFMDSTGISVLVATERRANVLGGGLSLVNPQKIVARVLKITSMDRHFAIFPTVAEAVPRGGDEGRPGRETRTPDRETTTPDRETRTPDRETGRPDRGEGQPDREEGQPDRENGPHVAAT